MTTISRRGGGDNVGYPHSTTSSASVEVMAAYSAASTLLLQLQKSLKLVFEFKPRTVAISDSWL